MATRKNSLYVFVMQLQTVSCTKRKYYRYSVNFQSSTPPPTTPPPPPKKKKVQRASSTLFFSAPSTAFQQGSLISLLLKSKDPISMTCIMIFNARQLVAGDNVYFQASQSVLARVFSITCLFACEGVCYELAVISMKYYIKLHGSWVLRLRSSAFGLQVFSLQFKDNCLLFMTKCTLFNCHYYYYYYFFFFTFFFYTLFIYIPTSSGTHIKSQEKNILALNNDKQKLANNISLVP